MQHGTVFSTGYDAKTVRGKNINYKCLKTVYSGKYLNFRNKE